MYILPECIYVPRVCDDHRDQTVSDLLEPELQMIVSH